MLSLHVHDNMHMCPENGLVYTVQKCEVKVVVTIDTGVFNLKFYIIIFND